MYDVDAEPCPACGVDMNEIQELKDMNAELLRAIEELLDEVVYDRMYSERNDE